MTDASSPRRRSRVALMLLALGLLPGCDSGSMETTPPPPAAGAPPPAPAPLKSSAANPGSDSSQDSTLRGTP